MAEVVRGIRNWGRALLLSGALAPVAVGACASGDNNATEKFSMGVECADPNADLLVLSAVMKSRFIGEVQVTCDQDGEQTAPKSIQLLEGSGSTEVRDSSSDSRKVLDITARYTKGGYSGQNPKLAFMTPDKRAEEQNSGAIEIVNIQEITRAEVVNP